MLIFNILFKPKSPAWELFWFWENNIDVNKDIAEQLFKLLNTLEDNDDVQNISSNFEVSEEVLHKLTE